LLDQRESKGQIALKNGRVDKIIDLAGLTIPVFSGVPTDTQKGGSMLS